MNKEFDWNKESLQEIDPVQDPAIRIEKQIVIEAVNKMKNDNAPGPSSMVAEILKAGGDNCTDIVTDLVNAIIHLGKVPSDWQVSSIVNSFKGKGKATKRGS